MIRNAILSLLALILAMPLAAQKKAAAKKAAKAPAPAVAAPAQPATAAPAKAEEPAIDAAAVKKYGVSEELVESLKRKRVLNDKDFEKKKEGGFVTGLPLLNSDPNTGFGYGARLYYFYNGEKQDPLFRRTPYRHQVYAQFFQTTFGYQYHELNWDSPYILNSLFRVRSAIVFEKNIWANYFGTGARTMGAVSDGYFASIGQPGMYEKYSDYNNDLRKVTNGTTNSGFNRYSFERPAAVAFFERDFFGGIVRPQFGVHIGKYNIRDLEGSKVQADGGEAVSNKTLLGLENQAGLVRGYDGGWHNLARVGLTIDTRDFEPDPNKGQMFEAIVETSNKGFGSQFNFTRYTVSQRVFYSPFEKLVDLVIAGRAVYTQAVGDVPFYSLDQFSSTERIYQGALGGLRSLRGYKASRFMATNMALANLELRWTMFDFTVAGQRFAPIFVPFFDIGSAFDQPKDISTSIWRYSYGAGLRIAWNQATIIMVDYAMSKEDSNLFINFNHIF
jgi:hypothetical protein